MAQAMIMRRGGGSGIKLKPVIYSSVINLPASASNGTLAIITSIPIASITMNIGKPTGGAIGDLWFEDAAIGGAPILLSQSPLINVYPANVYQHNGTTWVYVQAFVFQQDAYPAVGVWRQVIPWLYDTGNRHAENGGDWQTIAGGTAVTYDATYITLHPATGVSNAIRKIQSMDLTPYRSLKLIVTNSVSTTTNLYLRVYSNEGVSIASVITSGMAANETRTLTLDLSAISQVAKPGVSTTGASAIFFVRQMWLE